MLYLMYSKLKLSVPHLYYIEQSVKDRCPYVIFCDCHIESHSAMSKF